jgi:SsrA-binding protein
MDSALTEAYVRRTMSSKESSDPKGAGIKLIVKNRKASFDYHVESRYEAGLQLPGTEVKSLRAGQVNLSDSYAASKKGELFLVNCNIAPYASSGAALNHVPLRARKLLLNRRELEELNFKADERGYTLVPLSMYFKDGRAKVELGVCRGKLHGDKREAIAEREQRREMDRALRGAHKRGRE